MTDLAPKPSGEDSFPMTEKEWAVLVPVYEDLANHLAAGAVPVGGASFVTGLTEYLERQGETSELAQAQAIGVIKGFQLCYLLLAQEASTSPATENSHANGSAAAPTT